MKRIRIGKKFMILCLAGSFCMMLLSGCGDKKNQDSKAEGTAQTGAESTVQSGTAQDGVAQTDGELLMGKHHVNIHIKDMGTISVELDADSAPVTVTNFMKLAEEGFYDGLTFHRIIDGFMMQGGDPLGNGTGGSENTITGEFSENGVDNPLSHTRGAISMARSQDYNSASSQFFIMHQDNTYLDGEYAAFGYVTEGMDIVDDICENTTGQDINGIVPAEDRPVIESVEVVD